MIYNPQHEPRRYGTVSPIKIQVHQKVNLQGVSMTPITLIRRAALMAGHLRMNSLIKVIGLMRQPS
jgi:hypothetical protein